MRSRAGKQKRVPTSVIVQGCTAAFAFLLQLNGTVAHEEQIPEPMTLPVAVENRETNHTQIDLDKRGDSTFPPEKATVDDASRGTRRRDVEPLDGPNNSESNEENVRGEGNRQDVKLSADSPAADAIEALQQQQQPPHDHYAETGGDNAYTASSDAATHSDGVFGAPHPEIVAGTGCEGVGESVDEGEAGGSVLGSMARHGSSGRANGSTFEQTGNEMGKVDSSQQGERAGRKEQGQRREEGDAGMGGSEILGTPGSPFLSFDHTEQPVRLAVTVGGQASNRDAGTSHVHGSISIDGDGRGAAGTVTGRSPFDVHKRSGGAPDEAQAPDTTVAAEATATPARNDPENPYEYLAVEYEDRNSGITGDASSATDARLTPRAGPPDNSPPSDIGGGLPVSVYPYYGAPRRDSSTALRDCNEARTGVKVESTRRRETPAKTADNHESFLNRVDNVEGFGDGQVGDRGREEGSGGSSTGSAVGFERGSPEELAQRVRDVEAELAKKLLAEEDAKSLLDIWVERAREFVLTRTVPPTDVECDFNWSRLRCEPKCLCGSRLRFGDYTPGRSCRLLHPWERRPDCEGAWDPSDEPALRRLGAATKRAMRAVKRAYDARVAPPTDPDCRFDLETRRCQPQPACRLRFRWGDISLSSACRLV